MTILIFMELKQSPLKHPKNLEAWTRDLQDHLWEVAKQVEDQVYCMFSNQH